MESMSLRPVHSSRRLLFVFAHPDDESFGTGGTIARYAGAGVAVHYACATRGEVGTVPAGVLEPFAHLPEAERLGALRESELHCAAQHLGLAGLHLLGYRDSGMSGSASNRDPRAFVNADPRQVSEQLVKLIRDIRPQVVVTFDPYGGYGHPDHIFSHRCTTEAFRAAGDPGSYPQAGQPYSPRKLYWTSIPRRWLKVGIGLMRLIGRDPRRFGQNRDVDLTAMAVHDYPPTTAIDVWPYLPIKAQAARCHASQGGSSLMFDRLPAWLRRRLLGTEHYTLAEPAPNGRRTMEGDLFDGVGA